VIALQLAQRVAQEFDRDVDRDVALGSSSGNRRAALAQLPAPRSTSAMPAPIAFAMSAPWSAKIVASVRVG
jgi:hypothetical protein